MPSKTRHALKQEDYFFPFKWHEKAIWKIDAPVTEIELSQIDWLLDVDWFGTDEHPLTPNEVMSNPELDSEHYKRIENADMSYPIDLGMNHVSTNLYHSTGCIGCARQRFLEWRKSNAVLYQSKR